MLVSPAEDGLEKGSTVAHKRAKKLYSGRARYRKAVSRSAITGAFVRRAVGKRRNGAVRVSSSRDYAGRAAHVDKVPTIAFRGFGKDRRACVRGTALDVWEIVEAYKSMGLERLLAESDLSRHELAAALIYYRQHPDDIDRRIAENRRSEDEWRELYPDVFAAR